MTPKPTIYNFTLHKATPEQQEAGVVDLSGNKQEWLMEQLIFTSLPDRQEISNRVVSLCRLAETLEAEDVMIGGALWLMGPLVRELRRIGVRPLFAYSERESADEIQPDGSVRKTTIFKHKGWVVGI